MTHLTRVFNPETRALTSVERRYAGQIGDAISTVLHFEYKQLDFLSQYVPYIQFGVYDEDGNQLIYGPAPKNPSEAMAVALEDRIYFDGIEFSIPWAVTSRVKSMRVDYQLFFVKVGVEFDGRNIAKLKPTEIVNSVVDSIALKPSITCEKRPGHRNPCACPPFAPTGAEPNLLGWVELWKEYGIVVPVTQELKEPEFLDRFGVPYEPTEDQLAENPPVVVLKFRTYNGNMDSEAELKDVPVMRDGKILYFQVPNGNDVNTYPLLKEHIGNGQSIIYDEASKGFIAYDVTGIYQFRGTCTSHDLDVMGATRLTLTGTPLRNGDVYSLTDRRAYGFDELGDVKWYEAGTNWVWSEQEAWEPLTGDLDLNKYQLKSFKVTSWDEPTDEQYPSAKLTKDSLDEKLDDSQVITSWATLDPTKTGQEVQIPSAVLVKQTEDSKLDDSQVISSWDKLDPSLIGQDVQIPAAKLVKDDLDSKTDIVMAIPNWDAGTRYNKNGTVIYNGTIFISLIGGNVNSKPIDDEGNISDYWSMIQGGNADGTEAQRWVIGDGKKTIWDIRHNFGTKDLFVAMREKASGRMVQAGVTFIRPGIARITFSEPPAASSIYVTISPAVPAIPPEEGVVTNEILSDSKVWTMNHNLHRIVTVQTFNQNGVELTGAVSQNMATLDTVTVEFNQPVRGTMVVR